MNNYFNNMNGNFGNMYSGDMNTDGSKVDMKLVKKLQKQAGDNMTFNMCGYGGDAAPSDLFDIYNGFIRGNMFPELFNQYKLSRPFDINPMNEQAELLTKVDAYCFAAHDLNLYLDTHPNDREMINLFKELSEDSKRSILEYENRFGPLFVDSSENYPWAWNESPWPWENN